MSQTINIPNYDPQGGMTNTARALGVIMQSGSVTLDVDYGVNARWLFVGATGNVTVKKWDGTTQLYGNLAAGVCHPIASIGILSSGTTATGIVWGN